MEVQVGQLDVSFHQAFYTVNHQFRRDVVVFEYRVGLKLCNTKLVEVFFNVFVSKTKELSIWFNFKIIFHYFL